MSTINFATESYVIGNRIIVRMPESTSKQLSSRGPVMVAGTLNGTAFETPLEPDGRGGHWLDATPILAKNAANTTVTVTIEPVQDWHNPTLSSDVVSALKADADAKQTWSKTTPRARWEWVRWIRATNNTETRQRRITVACSKLRSGMRRPCCFNSNMCTVPEVSKNGVLLDPPQQG